MSYKNQGFFAGGDKSCLFTARVNRRLGQVENYFPAVGTRCSCLTWPNPVLSLHCGGARGIRDRRWLYCIRMKSTHVFANYIIGRDRASYTAAEKLKVVQFAEIHGNRAAGREFNVNEANFRSWRLKENRLQALPKKKRAERGRERKFSKLLAWVQDIRQQGTGISLGSWE